jgi:hypothetical protein
MTICGILYLLRFLGGLMRQSWRNRACSLSQYTQTATFRRRDYVAFGRTFYIDIPGAIISPARPMALQIQSLTRFAVVFAIFAAWTWPAMADQQRPFAFQVPKNDSAAAETLASELTALSPRVNREEAKLLAKCAYATASQLRKQYRMFGPPVFNNFLVHWGIRKRGYCFHWSEDLLVAFDALKLASLELRWGEAHAGTWRENNCIVVTAKGQQFNRGIILDCWRHLGHLHWGPVLSDADPYVENTAYARFVRARSTPKGFAVDHPFAFQTSGLAKGKPDN